MIALRLEFLMLRLRPTRAGGVWVANFDCFYVHHRESMR
jgi:hypothetical protein